jgi:hypothetical protein
MGIKSEIGLFAKMFVLHGLKDIYKTIGYTDPSSTLIFLAAQRLLCKQRYLSQT